MNVLPMQFLPAELWARSQRWRLLCSLEAEGFPGSVRTRSCLGGGSLTRARRPELVPILVNGSRCLGARPWSRKQAESLQALATSLLLSPHGLPSQCSSSSRHYLFLHLECVGRGSRIASCCRLARRLLTVEMSLSLWRSSPLVAPVLPVWNTSAGDFRLGTARASVQGLRRQKVAQEGSLALEH